MRVSGETVRMIVTIEGLDHIVCGSRGDVRLAFDRALLALAPADRLLLSAQLRRLGF